MKTQLMTLANKSKTSALADPVSGRTPFFTPLLQLLCAAALLLLALAAQAGVAFTSLHSFGVSTNGYNLAAGLVQGRDGYFYGTTLYGGTNGGNGTVFKISTNGRLTSLHTFTGGLTGGSDGANPQGTLVQGSDGYFYGTTVTTVFRVSAGGTLATLHSFNNITNANPQTLVQGRDGNFYFTTTEDPSQPYGPYPGYGSVFKMSPAGAVTRLYSFGGTNDGANPYGALVQGSDGNLYGTTSGGTNNAGTVFKISTNGAFTSLYSFTGGSDGYYPSAALVQGSDGAFYGITGSGGQGGNGTVFRLALVPSTPPQLSLVHSGPNLILTWPTNAPGFTLQSTTSLGSSAVWSTNTPAPVVVNDQNVVTNPISGTQQFFRLSQ